MDFLSLCKKARHEARISGDGPSTVTNQIGVLGDVVEAVRDAWLEIQMMQSTWRFMQGTLKVELSPGHPEYSPGDLGIQDIARVRSARIGASTLHQLSELDERLIEELSNRTGTPTHFVFTHERKLKLLPLLQNETEVTVGYSRPPMRLKENGDQPNIPSEHRPIIAWLAVTKLSANESDSVIYQKALEHYDMYLSNLQDEFLPKMELGGALM